MYGLAGQVGRWAGGQVGRWAGGHTLMARNVASNSRYGSQLSFSELFGNFTDLFTNLNLFSDKTNKYKKKLFRE